MKDPGFYTRTKYTPEFIKKAITRFEYINEVFHSQEAYNNLNILNELAVIKPPILIIQRDLDYTIGLEPGKMIYKGLKNVPQKD